jgi:hypothetical protein
VEERIAHKFSNEPRPFCDRDPQWGSFGDLIENFSQRKPKEFKIMTSVN